MTTLQIIAIIAGIALIPLSTPKIMLYKKKLGAYTFKGFHAIFLCFLIVIGSAVYIDYKNKVIQKSENLEQHNKMVGWALAVIEVDYEKVFGKKRNDNNQEYFTLLPDYHQVEDNLFN